MKTNNNPWRVPKVREYKGWCIEKRGGFCTMLRFVAFFEGKMIWAFRLKEVKVLIDAAVDNGYETIPSFNREPLYI